MYSNLTKILTGCEINGNQMQNSCHFIYLKEKNTHKK